MMLGKRVNYSDLISILAFFGLRELVGNVFDEIQSNMHLATLCREFGEYLGESFQTPR